MKAEYINHMGDDTTVVDSARVSFNKTSELFTTEDNTRLIKFLAKHNHWSPFAHPMVSIRETVPIFVARQRFKHMIGFTYNEVSRRYVDDAPDFFTPNVWRSRPEGSVKQGSGDEAVTYIPWEIGEDRAQIHVGDMYQATLNSCMDLYTAMLDGGVAPEQARMVLPQSMYTSYWVTGSLAAWARAYKQRIDSHAQKEIQDLAKEWDKIIRPLFPVSWGVLTDGNNN